MGEDSRAVSTRESLLFGPVLSRRGKDLWEEPRARLLGSGTAGAHCHPGEPKRSAGEAETAVGWDTGNTLIPTPTRLPSEAGTYPLPFKVQAAQFP